MRRRVAPTRFGVCFIKHVPYLLLPDDSAQKQNARMTAQRQVPACEPHPSQEPHILFHICKTKIQQGNSQAALAVLRKALRQNAQSLEVRAAEMGAKTSSQNAADYLFIHLAIPRSYLFIHPIVFTSPAITKQLEKHSNKHARCPNSPLQLQLQLPCSTKPSYTFPPSISFQLNSLYESLSCFKKTLPISSIPMSFLSSTRHCAASHSTRLRFGVMSSGLAIGRCRKRKTHTGTPAHRLVHYPWLLSTQSSVETPSDMSICPLLTSASAP